MGVMASAAIPDLVQNQTEWIGGYLWSRMSDLEPPPSLVKCLGATVAGSIFALLGMMMENFRNRRSSKTREGISREELGNLIPKRPRGQSTDGQRKGATGPSSSQQLDKNNGSGTARQRNVVGRTMS